MVHRTYRVFAALCTDGCQNDKFTTIFLCLTGSILWHRLHVLKFLQNQKKYDVNKRHTVAIIRSMVSLFTMLLFCQPKVIKCNAINA